MNPLYVGMLVMKPMTKYSQILDNKDKLYKNKR